MGLGGPFSCSNVTEIFHAYEGLMKKYYQNEPKFNAVYSRNNLPKIKNGSDIINLDKYESIGIIS